MKSEKLNLIEIMSNPEDKSYIILKDEQGKEYVYEQVYYNSTFADKELHYALMRDVNGAKDEAIPFRIEVDKEGNENVYIEDDPETVRDLYEIYLETMRRRYNMQ